MPSTDPAHIAARLVRLYGRTTSSERSAGIAWYYRAADTIAELAREYGHDPETVAAVVAILSPRIRWSGNVRGARAVLDAHTHGDCRETCASSVPGFNRNIAKAFSYLDGDASALSGPKVTAFAANLRGDLDYVTLDVWATRAAVSRDQPRRDHARIAEGYRRAARTVGIPPAEFQAVLWVHTRGGAE